MEEQKFEFEIDEIPYIVKVIPFKFNMETRYRVSYNGGKEDIFVWDPEVGRIRAIDDAASTLPDSLGLEISRKIIQAQLY
ncbi:MAG: hypothetical protein ACTHOB_04090 [Ginsengibacter sp.]